MKNGEKRRVRLILQKWEGKKEEGRE